MGVSLANQYAMFLLAEACVEHNRGTVAAERMVEAGNLLRELANAVTWRTGIPPEGQRVLVCNTDPDLGRPDMFVTTRQARSWPPELVAATLWLPIPPLP